MAKLAAIKLININVATRDYKVSLDELEEVVQELRNAGAQGHDTVEWGSSGNGHLFVINTEFTEPKGK